MLVQYPYTQNYLFTALAAAPDLYDIALNGLTEAEADRRPDPERFTIREIMAHLAEWEEVFLLRMQRIANETYPTLEGYDEWAWATEHHYAATDPREQAALFRERRGRIISFLRARTAEEWERAGLRPEIGAITLEALALLVPLHDLYHLKQIYEWRGKAQTATG
jgi:hypothetical protein